ncbi:MAG TPA: hypothetical protein VFG52_04475 [Xanthomonadales bacterium]|nr:hypothetical protein [Xanthomonadales bacterium]
MNIALLSLWMPILLSAVAVFFASSLIWMVLQYHNSDWKKLPNEEAARDALKGLSPGNYSIPHCAGNKERADPAWQARYAEGPVVMLNVFPHGSLAMGKQLGQWFVYCVVISTLVAYAAGTTLMAGAEGMKVFQVTATVAVLAYAGSAACNSIWFGNSWSRTAKDILDGLIYGHLTAGIFCWLWP